ncbi:MAG: M28 family metallopeptidase [Halovenus sp.]
MAELPTELVGDITRNSVAWATLTDLVDAAPRMAGHEGETAAAGIVAERFERAGLREIAQERFAVPEWSRGDSSLAVHQQDRQYDKSHQVIALPGSPPGRATGEVVDVGYGTPAEFDTVDVTGALVLARSGTPADYDRWLHRREKYRAAVEGGAAGFVFRSHREGCLPPTGGVGDDAGPGPIPAIGVSREFGRRLVRHRERGELSGTLSVACQTGETTSVNVSGALGPTTDEELLVTAHHDAHDIAEGAKDNGTGCALVVETARLLAQAAEQLDISVRFVTFGAEEIGLRGSSHMASERSLENIRAVVNLDAIGGSRDLGVATHGFTALGDAFRAAAAELDVPIEVADDVEPHSDHWPFVRQGVPGTMVHTMTGSGERGWGHTHADTLDKLDRRDLRDLVVPIAAAVLWLAGADRTVEHVDPGTVEERAREQGYPLER